MPVLFDKDSGVAEGFRERLLQPASGVALVKGNLQQPARTPDLTVVILNLMPGEAMGDTERHWARLLGSVVGLYVELLPARFDEDPRGGPSSARLPFLDSYQRFSDVVKGRDIDGLIITGDNLELDEKRGFRKPLPFEEITYNSQLREIIAYEDENVPSTIYSCLASHFALNVLYGLPREIQERKVSGVFEAVNGADDSELMAGIGQTLWSPQSRNGDTPLSVIRNRIQTPGDSLAKDKFRLLAVSEKVGWLALQRDNKNQGIDLFLQGHPEYHLLALHKEYHRDLKKDPSTPMPENLYRWGIPRPEFIADRWSGDATKLIHNWLRLLVRLKAAKAQGA